MQGVIKQSKAASDQQIMFHSMKLNIYISSTFAMILALSQTAVAPQETKVFKPTKSVQVDSSISSEVLSFSQPGMSRINCVMRCSRLSDCSIAVFNRESRLCRAVRLLQSPGPNGSHVSRRFGDELSDEVWLVEDFSNMVDRLLGPVNGNAIQTSSPYAAINGSEVSFIKSGSGRNGTVQLANISVSGCYRIEARGARGGSALTPSTLMTTAAAGGATMAGNFSLSAGTQLSIVVGQRGTTGVDIVGGGGGGGSFVYRTTDGFLYVAAGGSGGASDSVSSQPGQAGKNGTWPNAIQSPPGGVLGQPGASNSGASGNYGGPGAGWLSGSKSTRRDANCGEGGGGRAEGWIGGRGSGNVDGGFGGCGGAAMGEGDNGLNPGDPSTTIGGAGGGGGGGYSGGAAATTAGNAGGGGGSLCGGVGCVGATSGNSGNDGFVSVRLLTSGSCNATVP